MSLVSRYRGATALAGGLMAMLAFASPAAAQSTQGGAGGNGGAGGTSSDTGPGGTGGSSVTGGGGGGGAGATGGSGGTGAGGANGGSGGAHGTVSATLPIGSVTGGSGGNGSAGSAGVGGGGGAGGYGAVITGSGDFASLNFSITGGAGGSGGTGIHEGRGGQGGHGLIFTNPGGATLTINQNVRGGSGGLDGGDGDGRGDGGAAITAGGFGILGANLDLTLNALLAGGTRGDGSNPNTALFLTGGSNFLRFGSGWGLSGGVHIGGGGLTLDTTTLSQISVSNIISGTGSLTKIGTGTLILTGANTYSGNTNINAGLVQIGAANGLGTSRIVLNGGDLRTTATMTLSNQIDWEAVDTTVSAAGGTTLTLDGFPTVISRASAYPTLRFGTVGDTGTVVINASSGSLAFNSGAQQGLQTLIVQGGTLKSGSRTINNLGFFTREFGETRIDAGATLDFNIHNSTIANLQGAGTLLNGATTTIERGSFSGIIANGTATHSLAKTTGGLLILSGDNSYSGTTTVSGGTLLLTGTIASATGTTINGGTLQIGNYDPLVAGTGLNGTLSGNVTVSGSGNLTFNRAGTFSFANLISATGSVTQASTGTLLLTGANTYSGNTNINAGLVQTGAANGLGTSRIVLNGGDLRTTATMTLSNQIDWEAVDTTVSAAGGTTLTLDGFPTVISRASAYPTLRFGTVGDTGTVVINASSGSLAFNSGAQQGLQTLIVQGGTLKSGSRTINNLGFFTREFGETRIDAGATLDFNIHNSTIANLQGAGTLLNGATTTIERGSFSGIIANGTATHSLAKTTGGLLILSGDNSYTGTTTVSGGTLQIGAGGTSGTLGSGSVVNNAVLTFNRSDTLTIGGNISGTGSLAQAGAGTLILTGANGYSGDTLLQAGTVQIGATGTLGGGTIRFNGGALRATENRSIGNVLTFGGSPTLISAADGKTLALTGLVNLAGNGTIRIGNPGEGGTVVLNPGLVGIINGSTPALLVQGGKLQAIGNGLANFTAAVSSVEIGALGELDYAGHVGIISRLLGTGLLNNLGGTTTVREGEFAGIIESGALTKDGPGTLILTGSNNYTGVTRIEGGTLQIGNEGTSGRLGTGAVTFANDANLSFKRSDTVTLDNVLSGFGNLVQAGTGTLIVTGANGYSGDTLLQSGTVQIGATGTFGTSTIRFDGGALRATESRSIGNVMTFGGNPTLLSAADGKTLALTGLINLAGNGTIRIGNPGEAGTIVLNPSLVGIINGSAPELRIQGGTLRAGGNGLANLTTAVGSVRIDSGAIVDFNGFTGAIRNLTGAGILTNSAATAPTTTIEAGNFSGSIQGSTNLVKATAGTLILSGTNSHTGTTTLGGGTLQARSLSALGAGALVQSGGTLDLYGGTRAVGGLSGTGGQIINTQPTTATLAVTQNDSTSYSGLLTDGAANANRLALSLGGTGTLTLTGANSYSGGTTLNGGTLVIGDIGAIGSGPLTLSGGNLRSLVTGTLNTTLTTGAPSSGGNTISAVSGSTLTLNLGSDTSLGGDLRFGSATDTGTIVFSPSGVSGNPAIGLYVDGGTLRAGNSLLAAITNLIARTEIASGATLDLAGLSSNARIRNLQGAGTLLNDGQATSIAAGDFSGIIGGTQSIRKFGTGTLVLGGANTFSGGATVAGGTLQIGNAGAIGTGLLSLQSGGVLSSTGSFTLNNSFSLGSGGGVFNPAAQTVLTLAGTGDGTGSLTKSGSGTLILSGTNSYSGPTTISAGTLQIGSGTSGIAGSGGFSIASGANLAFGRSDAVTVSNPIGGAGSLTQLGTGTLILTGANTYSGGTTIAAGTLRQGSAGALGTGSVTLAGGTLDLGAFDLRLSRILGGVGSISSSGGGGLTFAPGESVTLGAAGGSLNIAVPLVVGDTNTLTLLGNNNLTGGITLAGRLNIGSTGAAGGAGNRITTLGSVIGYANGVDNAAPITLSSSTTQLEVLGTDSATQSGVISESGGSFGFEKIGTGTLTLTAANTYTGRTTISAGTLALGNLGGLGSGAVALSGGNLRSLVSGTLSTNLNTSRGLSNGNTVSAAAGETLILDLGGSSDFQGNVRFGSATDTGTILLSASGIGFDPGIGLFVNGGTLRDGNGLLGALTNLISRTEIASGATLDLAGLSLSASIRNLQGAGTLLNAGRNTSIAAGDFAGIIGGIQSIAKTGSGTLILSGTNSYTGQTSIDAGTLQIGNGAAGGTLGAGSVVIHADGRLLFNRTDSHSFGNSFSGAGTLTQAGTGTTILTGANTHTGDTIISAGILQIGNGGTTGGLGTGAVTNNASLVFNRSDAITVANLIGGTGSVSQSGSGTLTLTGNNSFAGGTLVNSGILRQGHANALGTGSVGLAGGTLDLGAFDLALRRINGGLGSIVSSGGALMLSAGDDVTFGAAGGSINTAVPLSVVEGSTLRLLGNNNLTGGIQLAGRLVIGETGAAGGAANTITTLGTVISYADGVDNATPITLDSNDTQFEVLNADIAAQSDAIGDTGGARPIEKIGAGTLILTANNSYSGGTTISAGTLQIGGGGTTGTLGAGNVTNNGSLAFVRSNTVTVDNAISGTGSLTQGGAGSLILTGNNSYSGRTTINAGTLQVGNGGTTGTVGTGAVVNHGTLAFNRSDALAVANAISGSGSLIQAGTGETILRANSSYTGATTINAGTLAIGTNNALPTGSAVTIASGAALSLFDSSAGTQSNLAIGRLSGGGNVLLGSGTLTVTAGGSPFGGVISGTGNLVMAGITTQGLNGNNSYTGTTTIQSGTIQVGNGGTSGSLGSGDVILAAGAQLTYLRTGAFTVANRISGNGTLALADSGFLTLSGDNSYSGGTLLSSSGTVVLGSNSALGTGALEFQTIATLDLNGFSTAIGGLASRNGTNVGVVTNGGSSLATLTVAGSADGTYGGTIQDGTGGVALVKAGTGTLTLGGANSYTGGTTVNGGTLIHESAGALGTGNLTVNGGELGLRHNLSVTSLAGTGGQIAATGGGDYVLTVTGGTTIYAGTIEDGDGSIGLGVFNGADLTLTGNNNFTFGLSVEDATVRLGHNNAAGGLNNLITTAGALATIGYLDGVNSVTGISLGADETRFFVGGGASAEQSGDIAGCACLGITKTGAGELTLSGSNSYGGFTTILEGTLSVSATENLGDESFGNDVVLNGGRLRALGELIMDRGMFVETGGGTVYTGANIVSFFGLDLTGTLTKTGSGDLISNFGVSGTGGLVVSQGRFGIGGNAPVAWTGTIDLRSGTTLFNPGCACVELDNAIVVDNATIDANGAGFALYGPISGGNVRFANSSGIPTTISLAGANSYGATSIGNGTLLTLVDQATLGTGNVTLENPLTALIFNQTSQNNDPFHYAYGGTISGAGIVAVSMNGSLTLTGSNGVGQQFTGRVQVRSGDLFIEGALGDTIGNSARLLIGGSDPFGQVPDDPTRATLGGSGTFHGNVQVGLASINPGSSPGTLTIGGDLVLSSGTVLNYELGDPGAVGGPDNDLIVVGGNLTLDGTLNVTGFGAGYGPGYYRLFNYGGGLTNNGLVIGSIDGGFAASLLTNINGQVNLRLGGAQSIQYWDGGDLTGASNAVTGNGGAGTWSAGNANWTTPAGYAVNDAWQSQVGVFQGAAGGTVTIAGAQTFEELRFRTTGYNLVAGAGGGSLQTSGGLSIIDVGSGIDATIGAAITGSAGLTKIGGGRLLLSGANSYAGTTEVAEGTLDLTFGGSLAGAVVNSATFISAGRVQRNLTNSGTATNLGTINGNVTNSGDFGQFAPGIINGNLTNTGTASLAGQLNGSIANDAGTIRLAGGLSGVGRLTQAAGASFSLIDASLSGISHNLALGSLAGAGSIDLGTATLTTGSDGTSTSFAGVISGAGNLTKLGSGTFTLTGANTYTGTTTISGGVLSIGATGSVSGPLVNNATLVSVGVNNGALTNSGTATLQNQLNGALTNSGAVILTGTLTGIGTYTGQAGSTFDLAGFNTSIGSLAGTGSVVLGTATLSVGSDNNSTSFAGIISGSGGLAKVGSGTLTLAGANSFTGEAMVNGGALLLTGSLAGGVTTSGAGRLENEGTVSGALLNFGTTVNRATLAGGVTNSGTLDSSGTIENGLTNFGTASIQGTLSGDVGNSGTLTLTGATAGIGALSQVGALFDLNANSVTIGSIEGSGEVRLGSATLTTGGNNATTSFSGNINGSGNLTKVGAGTFTLAGANGYTGLTTVSSGTLAVTATGSLAGPVLNNATFASAGIVNGDLINEGSASLQNQLNGAVANSGTITLTGSLTGIGSYAGQSGSAFDLAGFSISMGSLRGSGSLLLGSGTLTAGSDNSATSFAGVISGSGGLQKVGGATLTLSGVNTYTGLTTVSSGTLSLASGGSLAGNVLNLATFSNAGTVGGVLDNRGVAMNSGTISGLVGNSGTLTSSGTLAAGLSNGGTAFLQGQVSGQINNAGIINLTGVLTSVAQLNQDSAGALNLDAFALALGNLAGGGTISLGTGALTVGTSNADMQFDGSLFGSGSLTKAGTGRLVLTGASGNTGSTTVAAGALELVLGSSLGGAVVNNATFVNAGTVGGGLANNGTTTNVGTINGGVVNNGDFAQLPFGVIDGALTNAGRANLAGQVNGATGNQGTVTLTGAAAITGEVTQEAAALFDLDGFAASFGSLAGTGSVRLGAATLITGSDNSSTSFAGVISGAGGLTKVGSGAFTLTGANSYGGLTAVAGGTLQIGLGGSLAGSVANSATFVNLGTVAGQLANSGTASNDGIIAGLVTNSGTGTNSGLVAGGLINNGGAAFTNGGTIGTGVINRGALVTNGTVNGGLDNIGTVDVRGRIAGVASNSGSIRLTGNLTGITGFSQAATGLLHLASYRLDLGFLSGSGTIDLGRDGLAELVVGSGNGSGQFDGTISGAGALTKQGTGMLVLSGANTFSGTTLVSAGSLGLSGGLAGPVVNEATFLNAGVLGGSLTNNGSTINAGTLGGGVVNNGAFTSNGLVRGGFTNNGTATLQNRVEGAIDNRAGTIAFTGGTDGIGLVTQSAGATIDLGTNAIVFGGLVGAGTIRMENGLRVGALNLDSRFDGMLSGGGALSKVGTGRLILGGVNSHSAGTVIFDGTLEVAQGGSLSSNTFNSAALINRGSIQASVQNAAGATFTNSGMVNRGVINLGTLASSGIINLGLVNSGTVSLSGQLNGFTQNDAGTITLTGLTTGISQLTQAAGATFNLAGFDLSIGTLSGAGTILLGGTAQPAAAPAVESIGFSAPAPAAIAAPPPLAPTSAGNHAAVVKADPVQTTLAAAPAADLALVRTGLVNGALDVPANLLTSPATEPPAQATAAPDSGPGATALVTFFPRTGGGATVAATLPLGSVAPIAAVQGSRVAAAPGNFAVPRSVLRSEVEGELPADAAGSAAADLLAEGREAGDEAALEKEPVGDAPATVLGARVGAVVDAAPPAVPAALPQATGATLTVGSSNLSSLFAGTISGDGRLVKVGTGTLVLTGANIYSGGTIISGGALQIGNGGTSGSILGPVVNNSLLIVNRSDALTLAGTMSGTGMFVQAGTGTTTLTGANSYSGGTIVTAGRLRGDATSLQGDIQTDASLEFAQAGAGTFAGRLFGAGLLEKAGAALLTFTGNNANFTGETRVLGGELAVNGFLSRSRVTVGSGATLSGTGVVGGLVAQSGAIVAPGSGGVGMLGVNGNVQLLAGSTLNIQVGPAGADLLLSNGTAQLGGNLALTHLGGMYRFNSTYVLLQADGGRSGTFASTTGLSSFGQAYRPEIVYTGTQVQLLFAPNQISAILGSNPATANQRSTMTRIDGAVAAGYDPQPLFALYWLDPASQLGQGLDALSGEVYVTAARIAVDDERLVREGAIGRVRATQDARATGLGAWGQAVGSWGDGDGDGNAAGYDRDTNGFMLGADAGGRWKDGGWRIGVMGFHLNTDVMVDRRGSSADLERSGVGLYGGLDFGRLRARFGASYADLRLDSSRTIIFPGFAEAAAGRTDGSAIQAFGEIAYRLDTGRSSFIEPFLAASIARVEFDAFAETGGGAAVRVADQENELGTATLGLRGETLLHIARGADLRLGGSLGVRHSFGDRSAEALIALDAAPNQAFSIGSAAVDRFSIVGNLDATFDLNERTSFSLGYSGVAGENARDHSVKATLSLRF